MIYNVPHTFYNLGWALCILICFNLIRAINVFHVLVQYIYDVYIKCNAVKNNDLII